MPKSKHEAIRDWLSEYPQLSSWLYFNTIEDIAGQIGVSTVEGDSSIDEDITGQKRKAYQLAIIMIKDFDTGTSSTNISAIEECENLMAWIDAQNDVQSFPEFPDGCNIERVENLQNMPSLALADPEQCTAKYMFPIRIIYTEN